MERAWPLPCNRRVRGWTRPTAMQFWIFPPCAGSIRLPFPRCKSSPLPLTAEASSSRCAASTARFTRCSSWRSWHHDFRFCLEARAMSQLHENDRMSEGDALFLYLERQGMPLNIASVALFDGTISLAECMEFVSSKLPLIPRYFQRVVIPPLNFSLPAWEYDPEFDIRNHVREVMLKRGTDA